MKLSSTLPSAIILQLIDSLKIKTSLVKKTVDLLCNIDAESAIRGPFNTKWPTIDRGKN